MSRYRYYLADDGTEFRYTTTPTLECPYRTGPPAVLADEAERLGLDLNLVWPREFLHGSDAAGATRCRGCGAELERAGFYAAIFRRTGSMGGMPVHQQLRRERFPLRREAAAWALEQFQIHKAILAEDATTKPTRTKKGTP